MSKKPPKKIDPNAKICKFDGCSDAGKIKGFCRLHFIVMAQRKRSGDEGEEEETERRIKKRDRRAVGARFTGPDDNSELSSNGMNPNSIIDSIENLDENDLDDLIELDSSEPVKKAG